MGAIESGTHSADSTRRGIQTIAARIVAAALVAACALALWDFPVGSVALAAGFAIYLAALWRYPDAWLVVVPAALPVFSLAFWSGRFFLDEFDLLLMVTLAALLWRGDRRGPWPASLRMIVALLTLSIVVSGLIGLLPPQPLDENAFSSYWSHYNSLRVAKGLAWGILLFWMAGARLEPARFRLLAIGMTLGLAGATLTAIWETWLFTGFATATKYRVTGAFSSMHTGGGHIEAYLACALPFAWVLLFVARGRAMKIAASLFFVLGAYSVLTTVARGGLGAVVVLCLVLGIGSTRLLLRHQASAGRIAASVAVVIAGIAVVVAGVQGGEFLKQRLARITEDAEIRLIHARKTLAMMDGGLSTWLFGMGLGSFPRTHLVHNLDELPGSYRFANENGNIYLNLNSGGTLYWAQVVSARPHTRYTLELDVRSDGQNQRLEMGLCEKLLFTSQRCAWSGTQYPADKVAWQRRKIEFDSGEVASGEWWQRRPVQLQLYNPQRGTMVQIDNVHLLDDKGDNALTNGDLSDGADRWFFKSGNHLPWHVKNIWLHAWFEQGIFGVMALGALFAAALVGVGTRSWQGDAAAIALLAATTVMLALGVLESFFDAPRLAMLLVFLLLLAAADRTDRPAAGG